jgi:hypothetical protein
VAKERSSPVDQVGITSGFACIKDPNQGLASILDLNFSFIIEIMTVYK